MVFLLRQGVVKCTSLPSRDLDFNINFGRLDIRFELVKTTFQLTKILTYLSWL